MTWQNKVLVLFIQYMNGTKVQTCVSMNFQKDVSKIKYSQSAIVAMTATCPLQADITAVTAAT